MCPRRRQQTIIADERGRRSIRRWETLVNGLQRLRFRRRLWGLLGQYLNAAHHFSNIPVRAILGRRWVELGNILAAAAARRRRQ